MDPNKTKNETKGSIDLNAILRFLTFLIFIFLCVSYSLNGPNEYINLTSIVLGSLLALEIYIFLLIEKRRRDPFVIILCFQLVFYFLFRILSLTIYAFSVAFQRFYFTAENLNYGLFFIIIANIALFLGFYINKVKPIEFSLVDKMLPINPIYIIGVFLFGLLMSFPGSLGLAPIEWFLGFIGSLFVDFYIIMLMIILYLILFGKRLKSLYKLILTLGIIFFVVLQTLAGSRGAMLMVMYFIIFASLAVNGVIRLKKTILIASFITIPLLMLIFIVSSYLRPRLENRSQVSSETIEVLKEFNLVQTIESNSDIVLMPLFDRIGYLDYGVELIANQDKYAPIFTYKYYGMSFIDNIFTPGFDVFNSPKISNSQKFIYNNEGIPMKSKVDEAYQSDEFTIYGEFYVTFGKWFSLVVMFLLAFFLKRMYVTLRGENIFEICVKRSILLMVFYYFIQSYGIDWIASITLGFIVTYFIFKRFFNFTYLKVPVIG